MLTMQFEIALACGAIGALLMVTSILMKRMIPLRGFAVGANAAFVVQFVLERNWILVALQASLVSINLWRLWSLRKLLVSIDAAKADPPIRDWLIPQMKKRKLKAGTVLFEIGDPADELYYIESGAISSPQVDRVLGPGTLVGEIGMFSQEHRRAATVVCDSDVVVYTMSDETAFVLFVSNPQIAFYLVRLIILQLRVQLSHAVAPAV